MLHKSRSHAHLNPQKNLDWKQETKKFYGIDDPAPRKDPNSMNVMDSLPDTIKREYKETYHEMKRNSNHRQFPDMQHANSGGHSNPMQGMLPQEIKREAEGQQYYNDVHAQRALGYAPKTDISKEHQDIDNALRHRESTNIGAGTDTLGRTLNDPRAHRSMQATQHFNYNLITFGRQPFGLPDTGNLSYSTVQKRGKGAEIMPS